MSHVPHDHPAALPSDKLLDECDVKFVRRSGPGGQHRNKVSTGVVLVHRPTGVKAEAAERRSQAENRAVALFRLRVNLALEIRRPVKETAPSLLWRSRCREGRIEINAGHDDFPALLAEALDLLAANDSDPRPVAETLGCSASQLIKLLKKEPRAMAKVNEERRQRELH
ncbi:MAG: peptide chain release factor-like protein [Pirellulales bacterium]|nr:peptide chain release factor-like protein [Pirellulales bacterium]